MGCFAAFMFLFRGVTAAHYILMILMFRCLTKDLHELPMDCNLGPAALKSAPFVKGWPPCAFANISTEGADYRVMSNNASNRIQ